MRFEKTQILPEEKTQILPEGIVSLENGCYKQKKRFGNVSKSNFFINKCELIISPTSKHYVIHKKNDIIYKSRQFFIKRVSIEPSKRPLTLKKSMKIQFALQSCSSQGYCGKKSLLKN